MDGLSYDRPVGERLLRRLEAALEPPSRVGIAGLGATRRVGDRGAQTHLPPNPYRALGEGGRSPPSPKRLPRPGRPRGEAARRCRAAGYAGRAVRITGAPKRASTPRVSCTPPVRPSTSGLPPDSSPRQPVRTPCLDAFRQPPPRTPARPVLKGDGALQGGVQATVFVKGADISRKDRLLDASEVAPGLLVDFGRARIPRPSC